jgi:hypothetical protein
MPRANRLNYIRPGTGRDGVVRYYLSRRGHRRRAGQSRADRVAAVRMA